MSTVEKNKLTILFKENEEIPKDKIRNALIQFFKQENLYEMIKSVSFLSENEILNSRQLADFCLEYQNLKSGIAEIAGFFSNDFNLETKIALVLKKGSLEKDIIFIKDNEVCIFSDFRQDLDLSRESFKNLLHSETKKVVDLFCNKYIEAVVTCITNMSTFEDAYNRNYLDDLRKILDNFWLDVMPAVSQISILNDLVIPNHSIIDKYNSLKSIKHNRITLNLSLNASSISFPTQIKANISKDDLLTIIKKLNGDSWYIRQVLMKGEKQNYIEVKTYSEDGKTENTSFNDEIFEPLNSLQYKKNEDINWKMVNTLVNIKEKENIENAKERIECDLDQLFYGDSFIFDVFNTVSGLNQSYTCIRVSIIYKSQFPRQKSFKYFVNGERNTLIVPVISVPNKSMNEIIEKVYIEVFNVYNKNSSLNFVSEPSFFSKVLLPKS